MPIQTLSSTMGISYSFFVNVTLHKRTTDFTYVGADTTDTGAAEVLKSVFATSSLNVEEIRFSTSFLLFLSAEDTQDTSAKGQEILLPHLVTATFKKMSVPTNIGQSHCLM